MQNRTNTYMEIARHAAVKYTASFWVSYKLQTVPTIMALSNHTKIYHAIDKGVEGNYGTNNLCTKPPCKTLTNLS